MGLKELEERREEALHLSHLFNMNTLQMSSFLNQIVRQIDWYTGRAVKGNTIITRLAN